jgi:NADPH:quinone reductase-like Zn-dependent oxidoreductase
MLADLVRAAAQNGLTPPIDKVFAFADAPAAYAYLPSGAHLGKVMVEVGG